LLIHLARGRGGASHLDVFASKLFHGLVPLEFISGRTSHAQRDDSEENGETLHSSLSSRHRDSVNEAPPIAGLLHPCNRGFPRGNQQHCDLPLIGLSGSLGSHPVFNPFRRVRRLRKAWLNTQFTGRSAASPKLPLFAACHTQSEDGRLVS